MSTRIETLKYNTPEEWKKIRRESIGASEIAAVLGVSPWQDAMSVYLNKVEGVEKEETEAMEWGTRIEDYIREKYIENHRTQVAKPANIFRLKDKPLHVSPDGVVVPAGEIGQEVKKGLECKNVGWRMAKFWDDGVPSYYQLQCQQAMHILEIPQWDVAVLIGGQEYREYTLDYDAELGSTIEEAAEVFWNSFIVSRTPPTELAGLDSMREYVRKCLNRTDGLFREGTDEERKWFDEYVSLRRTCKAMDTKVEEAGNNLRLIIGESEGIQWPDKSKATFREQKGRVSVDWETIARSMPGLTAKKIEDHTSVALPTRTLRVSGPGTKGGDE